MSSIYQTHGTFSRGRKTATGGTRFYQFVPPLRNQRGAAPGTILPLPGGKGAIGNATPHVTDFVYVVPTTAQTLTIMRPLNFTTFAADAAASQAAVTLAADPGSYSTAYNYPLPNGVTGPSTANNLIAAGDVVVYQTKAGQWVQDTVASGSGTTPSLTNNLPTGDVVQGGLFYFFGIFSDTDPATNEAHQQYDLLAAASGTAYITLQAQSESGLWAAYHAGDPLVFSSSNDTAAGFIELIAGKYLKH